MSLSLSIYGISDLLHILYQHKLSATLFLKTKLKYSQHTLQNKLLSLSSIATMLAEIQGENIRKQDMRPRED